MSLTEQDIQRIAKLARIRLTGSEEKKVQIELSNIFSMIEKLRAVDTQGTEPMSHAQDIALFMRPDEVSEVNLRENFQKNAPATHDGLYLVPKVIE